MNAAILDSVVIDPKARASVNYAKSRAAIDLASDCRKERRSLRNLTIETFGGKAMNGVVMFPDNSQARY